MKTTLAASLVPALLMAHAAVAAGADLDHLAIGTRVQVASSSFTTAAPLRGRLAGRTRDAIIVESKGRPDDVTIPIASLAGVDVIHGRRTHILRDGGIGLVLGGGIGVTVGALSGGSIGAFFGSIGFGSLGLLLGTVAGVADRSPERLEAVAIQPAAVIMGVEPQRPALAVTLRF